jgi:hypothetical protein
MSLGMTGVGSRYAMQAARAKLERSRRTGRDGHLSTWETADDVCGKHQAGHQAQQRVCDPFKFRAGILAVHGS